MHMGLSACPWPSVAVSVDTRGATCLRPPLAGWGAYWHGMLGAEPTALEDWEGCGVPEALNVPVCLCSHWVSGRGLRMSSLSLILPSPG